MNHRREWRSINGVLLLNKPTGISSQQAVTRLRYLYTAAKAGHTGTLDPMADGLLPVCFGEATKFTHMLLDADKSYLATIRLGITTATGDAEGEVLHTALPVTDVAQIVSALSQFRGDVVQRPPMYSAIRHRGIRLYEYARKGIEIERAPRKVTIYQLDLLESRADTLVIRVRCSKGTYIRTLAEDIGAALGCGASLAALTRTKVGELQLDDKCVATLDQLAGMDDAMRMSYVCPVDMLLSTLPALYLDAGDAARLRQGQQVRNPTGDAQELVRAYDLCGVFLGIAQVSNDGFVLPRRLVACDKQRDNDVLEKSAEFSVK